MFAMTTKSRKLSLHKAFLLAVSAFMFLNGCGKDKETPAPNGIPVGVNDNLTVLENSTAGTDNQINVGNNDVLGLDGGDDDNFSLLKSPTSGTVTELSDGVFEYIPNADFFGNDSFTYTITDKDGDSDDAKVNITVTEDVYVPTAEDFNNIDPNYPSFVSIINTTPEGKQWVKMETMSDEFDAWDVDKWKKSTWNYGVPVYMSTSAQNSGVTDGKLWIRATLNEANPEGRWFQSSRIHSKTKTSYPMYTEASIKCANISAFTTYWLNNGNSTDRDEIDIIENNPKPSCNCQPEFPTRMNSQYFHADSQLSPVEIRNDGNFLRTNLSDANPLKNVNWNEAYHTYGVWWKDEKHIQFYLDGEPAGSVVVGEHRDGTTYPTRVFTRDLEIIFDLWSVDANYIGGLAAKADLQNNNINAMYVDWVRTWKLEDL